MLAFAHLYTLHLAQADKYSQPQWSRIAQNGLDYYANQNLRRIFPCCKNCPYQILPPCVIYNLRPEELYQHLFCLVLNCNFTLSLNFHLPRVCLPLRILVRNPLILWKHILPYLSHPELDMYYVCRHKDVNCAFILSHIDSPLWYWKGLSRNPQIPLSFILSHSELPWNWDEVITHRITLDIALQYPSLLLQGKLLSRNPTLTWKQISQHPEIAWEERELVWNPFDQQWAARTIQKAWRRKRLSSCL